MNLNGVFFYLKLVWEDIYQILKRIYEKKGCLIVEKS